jgi:hypothetical protein
MVGTGRFELPTPRTPSECSTRLSHVPTRSSRLVRAGFRGSCSVYTSKALCARTLRNHTEGVRALMVSLLRGWDVVRRKS